METNIDMLSSILSNLHRNLLLDQENGSNISFIAGWARYDPSSGRKDEFNVKITRKMGGIDSSGHLNSNDITYFLLYLEKSAKLNQSCVFSVKCIQWYTGISTGRHVIGQNLSNNTLVFLQGVFWLVHLSGKKS